MPERKPFTLANNISSDLRRELGSTNPNFRGIESAVTNAFTYINENVLSASLYERYATLAKILPGNIKNKVDEALLGIIHHSQDPQERMQAKYILFLLHIQSVLNGLKHEDIATQYIDDILDHVEYKFIVEDSFTALPVSQHLNRQTQVYARQEIKRMLSQESESLEHLPERTRSANEEEFDPEKRALRRETIEVINQTIDDRLTIAEREALLLQLEGFDESQIAKKMGHTRKYINQLLRSGAIRLGKRFRELLEMPSLPIQEIEQTYIPVPDELITFLADNVRKMDTPRKADELFAVWKMKQSEEKYQRFAKEIQTVYQYPPPNTPIIASSFFLDIQNADARNLLAKIVGIRAVAIRPAVTNVWVYLVEEAIEAIGKVLPFRHTQRIEDITLEDVLKALLSGRLKTTPQRTNQNPG